MNDAGIPVGAELDAAVAKACGLKATIVNGECYVGSHDYEVWRLGHGETTCVDVPITWSPSTDADAALEAGKKQALFPGHLLRMRNDKWCIETEDHFYDLVGEGATMAEAICRAIVPMHGAK